ncbi:hypothetical protein EJ110_NYTH48647 [Nymphaea thermarum]|nr:hypothetical protein EJ110_NYTH48647 [Nymphaea thermarum]
MEIIFCVGYGVASLLLLFPCLCVLRVFTGKSLCSEAYPPVKGTMFHLLRRMDRLYDYQAEVAAHNKTVRYLFFSQSEVYTADPQNIEYILKTNFANYDKSACKDDILPDGFKVKKGDGVNYVTYAMGRMKYIWGDGAEDFRPERWLQDGVFKPESPFKFPAFHVSKAGPRTCLGKDFAYRQMKIVTALLTAFFRFKLKDPSKEVTYKTTLTLHLDQGLHVRAVHRHL